MYLNDKKLARNRFKWYDWLLFSFALLVPRVLGMKCILCLTFTTWLLWWVIRLKISIMMLHDNVTVSTLYCNVTSMCERSLQKSTIFQMFNKHYRHLQTVKSSQGLVAINLQRNLFILIVAWWYFCTFRCTYLHFMVNIDPQQ